MYFDSSVISQNSKDFHLTRSLPLTAHLSATNWMLSSRLSVFPKIPSPLCAAILLPSSLSFLLKVQHLSPSYIRNSFQHPSHSLSNDCSISRLLKYVCAPFPSHRNRHHHQQSYPPLSSLFSLSTSQSSLHLAVTPTGLCIQEKLLFTSFYPLPPSPAVSDHTVYMAFFFYPISHVPACLPAVGATESRNALLLQSQAPHLPPLFHSHSPLLLLPLQQLSSSNKS